MVLRPLAKFITLIINYFYSMLCRKASDSWVCAANALQKTFCKYFPQKNFAMPTRWLCGRFKYFTDC